MEGWMQVRPLRAIFIHQGPSGCKAFSWGSQKSGGKKEFPLNEGSLFIFGVTVQGWENCMCNWFHRCGLSGASWMLVFVIEHISHPVLLCLISWFARKSFRILTSVLFKPSACSSTHLPLDCLTTCLLVTSPPECGVLLCKLFRSIEHKVLVKDFGKCQLKSTPSARCSIAPALFSEYLVSQSKSPVDRYGWKWWCTALPSQKSHPLY